MNAKTTRWKSSWGTRAPEWPHRPLGSERKKQRFALQRAGCHHFNRSNWSSVTGTIRHHFPPGVTQKKTHREHQAGNSPATKASLLLNSHLKLTSRLGRERICLECKRPGFDSWGGKISWRRAWQPTPVFLPGELESTELQSMGSHRAGHHWVANTFTFQLRGSKGTSGETTYGDTIRKRSDESRTQAMV